MKELKTFRCEVDLYRNGMVFRSINEKLYERQTKGVYFVKAKTEDEAKKLLQNAIGFGSICIPKHQYIPDNVPQLKYKQICKWDHSARKYTFDIKNATQNLPNDIEDEYER